jgi:hypothetical protein
MVISHIMKIISDLQRRFSMFFGTTFGGNGAIEIS